jgi:uncharacterized glyoxalase superfamily protein PhnB
MTRLDAIGIVTKDMVESLRFYGLLGVDVPQPTEDHAEAALPDGVRLMWDTVAVAKQVDPEWEEPRGQGIGLAFLCDSAADVDAVHARVVEGGFASRAEPWNAFWGQRYARVVDPDGYVVDLFAPLSGSAG